MISRLATFVFLATLTSQSPAFAAEQAPSRPGDAEAQKIIDHCWAISLELRSQTSTAAQRAGALDTALCMENALVEMRDMLFSRNNEITREQLAGRLEQLRSAYGRFYWDLYNANDACFCGTQYHSMHNFMYAKLLESMIRDALSISSAEDYQMRVESRDKEFNRIPSAAPK